ncbi:MAG: hypothetical protein AB7G06_00160 [Bdellovibrionales bacterium]
MLFLILTAVPVQAAEPQLSFERGDTVLFNPPEDAIMLRSANIDRVRLRLYRLPDPTAENKLLTARLIRSVTENGLLKRAIAENAPVWQSDFILPNDEGESATQIIPLMTATGPLAAGDYILQAALVSPADGGVDPLQVTQWFSVAPIVMAAQKLDEQNIFTVVVDAATALPVPSAVVVALNAVGEIIGGTRADESGAAIWELPPDAIALRGEMEVEGGVRLHTFLPLTGLDTKATRQKSNGIVVKPGFGTAAPAGATAHFSIQVLVEGQPQPASIRYSFVQESYSFDWAYDDKGNWQYRTRSSPAVLQSGLLITDGSIPADLALPVGEGRYKLELSTADQRTTYDFTAGWWRGIETPQGDVPAPAYKDNALAAENLLWAAVHTGNGWQVIGGTPPVALPAKGVRAVQAITCTATKGRAACRTDILK